MKKSGSVRINVIVDIIYVISDCATSASRVRNIDAFQSWRTSAKKLLLYHIYNFVGKNLKRQSLLFFKQNYNLL